MNELSWKRIGGETGNRLICLSLIERERRVGEMIILRNVEYSNAKGNYCCEWSVTVEEEQEEEHPTQVYIAQSVIGR